MPHTLAIVLQVLGYELLLAMITTVRIENTLVFDLPFPIRATLGLVGIVFVLTGAYAPRRRRAGGTVEKSD